MAKTTVEEKSPDLLKVAPRNKELDLALQQITKDFGDGAIMRLGDRKVMDVEVIPTGNILIDWASAACHVAASWKSTDRKAPVKPR